MTAFNLGGSAGDDSAAVQANRGRAAAALGRDPGRVVWMNQVHGRDVAVVDAPWGDGPVPAVDGLVTTDPDLALAVLIADCVPVVLADQGQVRRVAHAAGAGSWPTSSARPSSDGLGRGSDRIHIVVRTVRLSALLRSPAALRWPTRWRPSSPRRERYRRRWVPGST